MAFGNMKEMKMPPLPAKKAAKKAPAEDEGGDDALDALFGGEGPEDEADEEMAEGEDMMEGGDDEVSEALADFSDEELQSELDRRQADA